MGCKIYHGPYVYNFKEIYKILEENNISKEINDYTELNRYLIEDLNIVQKEDKEISYTINNLSQKILRSTMKNINNITVPKNDL